MLQPQLCLTQHATLFHSIYSLRLLLPAQNLQGVSWMLQGKLPINILVVRRLVFPPPLSLSLFFLNFKVLGSFPLCLVKQDISLLYVSSQLRNIYAHFSYWNPSAACSVRTDWLTAPFLLHPAAHLFSRQWGTSLLSFLCPSPVFGSQIFNHVREMPPSAS